MKTFHVLVLLAAIVLNLLAAKIAFAPAPPITPVKWEYRIESVADDAFTQTVNDVGAQGWELVFARRATTGALTDEDAKPIYEMIFKRPTGKQTQVEVTNTSQ